MLHAGIRVYRYKKGFMHAKMAIVDSHFASVGTANLDMRSFYNNFEINAAFLDETIVEQLAEIILQDVADSEEIGLSAFVQRPRWQKIQEAVGRLFSPLL
jgi:cardiolipin synthase